MTSKNCEILLVKGSPLKDLLDYGPYLHLMMSIDSSLVKRRFSLFINSIFVSVVINQKLAHFSESFHCGNMKGSFFIGKSSIYIYAILKQELANLGTIQMLRNPDFGPFWPHPAISGHKAKNFYVIIIWPSPPTHPSLSAASHTLQNAIEVEGG